MAYKHVFFPELATLQKFYLLPGDLNKQRFVIHTPPSPPNHELMTHREMNKGRTCTTQSE